MAATTAGHRQQLRRPRPASPAAAAPLLAAFAAALLASPGAAEAARRSPAVPVGDFVLLQVHAGLSAANSTVSVGEPLRPPAPAMLQTSADAEAWLAAHNVRRCMHGVPLVAWSDAAYESAQEYVNGLTSLQHSDSYSEPAPAGPAGENLAMGYWTLEAAVDGWYSEVDCCSSLPGCQSGSCATGHFTAMVWRGVKEIGCAQNSNRIYICRYRSGDSLSGDTANMQGHYTEMVLPAVKSQAACEAEIGAGGDDSSSPTAAPTAAPAPAPAPTPTATAPIFSAPTPAPPPSTTASPTPAPMPSPSSGGGWSWWSPQPAPSPTPASPAPSPSSGGGWWWSPQPTPSPAPASPAPSPSSGGWGSWWR